MNPEQEFQRARLSLSVFLQAVFNDAKILDARDWEIFSGIGRYLPTPTVPDELKDEARARALGIVARYCLFLQKRPAAKGDDRGEVGGFDFPRTTEEARRAGIRVVPTYLLKRRADLVWDDLDELKRCAFPYPTVVTELTLGTRKEVYGRSLNEIRPPADDSNGVGVFDNGSQFYATAAVQATYAGAADGRLYYPKWRAADPSPASARKFSFDNLSDEYLRFNFQPYELEKGAVYIYVFSGTVLLIAKLSFNQAGQLHAEALVGEGLPAYGDFFQLINERVRMARKAGDDRKGEVRLIYSLDGTDHPPDFTKLKTDVAADFGLNILEQVVDPQTIVLESGSLTLADLDPVRAKWGHRSWLKEMVRLRFSEQWVWFWKNADVQMFYEIDREKLFLRELRAAEKASTGPLKESLRRFLKEANADPGLYLVRRGYKYGPDKRVIGSDGTFVYFYDNKRRLVTRLPMFIFWRDVNVSEISEEIFKNTRAIIPISKVVVWSGVVVMSLGIAGREAVVQGIRSYVAEKIEGIAIEPLIRETWKKFRMRIIVMLIFPVIDLLTSAPPALYRALPVGGKPAGTNEQSDGEAGGQTGSSSAGSGDSTGGKIYFFIKGFAEGFTEHGFHSMMERWYQFISLEPKSYRIIKLLMKIEGILRWIDEKMSLFRLFVTESLAKLLLNRFVSVMVEAGTGFFSLVNNLYFLDYDRAKRFLNVYAELAGEPAPTRAEWDRLRHQHFLESCRYWKDAVKEGADDIVDIYNDVQRYVSHTRGAAKVMMTLVLANTLSAGGLTAARGGLTKLVLMVLKGGFKRTYSYGKGKAGAVVGAGIVGTLILSDDVREEVLGFLKDFGELAKDLPHEIGAAAGYLEKPLAFAWATKERMQRFGQLLGIIVACLAVSKIVLKKASWKDRWVQSGKNYRKFVLKDLLVEQFNINPLMPGLKLALFHYAQLLEKLVAESMKSFTNFEDQIENILLGDPQFRDIIEEDEGLTLPKLLAILKVAENAVQTWLKRLAQVPGLGSTIVDLGDRIASLAPDKLPSLDKIKDGELSEVEWAAEALMFLTLSHLHGAISWLSHALESMLKPVNGKDQNPISVAMILELLGFNLKEADAMDMLDRGFEEVFQDQAA